MSLFDVTSFNLLSSGFVKTGSSWTIGDSSGVTKEVPLSIENTNFDVGIRPIWQQTDNFLSS